MQWHVRRRGALYTLVQCAQSLHECPDVWRLGCFDQAAMSWCASKLIIIQQVLSVPGVGSMSMPICWTAAASAVIAAFVAVTPVIPSMVPSAGVPIMPAAAIPAGMVPVPI